MIIPYSRILDIIISQLFLSAANYLIEIFRSMLNALMDNIQHRHAKNTWFWTIMIVAGRNIMMSMLFLIIGSSVYLLLIKIKNKDL